MEVIKNLYCLSGLIQALLVSWMIPAMAEGRVLEYKPLDFGLQVAGVQNSEIECLTRNIYFEAATEDGFGKLAVAMATLNRVRHPRFPNTIAESSARVRGSSTKPGPVNFPGFVMERVIGCGTSDCVKNSEGLRLSPCFSRKKTSLLALPTITQIM